MQHLLRKKLGHTHVYSNLNGYQEQMITTSLLSILKEVRTV